MLAPDRGVHEWYRFVLSYPPHLVREYLERFEVSRGSLVLDPFCGTGTTLVECKKLGIPSVGIEANPMAAYASRVKTDWSPEPKAFVEHANAVADATEVRLAAEGLSEAIFARRFALSRVALRSLPAEMNALLLKGSISPLPLHKTLVLLDVLEELRDDRFWDHERLALARALVESISNLHFGPEVGVGKPKVDAPVVSTWLGLVHQMASDLTLLCEVSYAPADVLQVDARSLSGVLKAQSIDAVITSPPYPNEKDYTRTTRLESVILGFLRSKAELRQFKKGLVCSNTRTVYVDDKDDRWIANHLEINQIASRIEARRVELGKTSGFERLYPRVTKLYFGGMTRHLSELRRALRPGAQLAYVVGDQASYLRVLIRTGKLIGEIAHSLGYEVMGTDLFRTRLATATREQLREEVLLLRWPGAAKESQASSVAEARAKYRTKRKLVGKRRRV